MKTLRDQCTEKEKTCAHCKHFNEESSKGVDGYCHRQSPMPYGWRKKEEMVDRYATWMAVELGDFCADFEPKETEG